MIYILLTIIIIQMGLIAFLWLTTSKLVNKSIEASEKLENNIKILDEYQKRIGNILDIDLFTDEPYVMEFISLMKNTRTEIVKTIDNLSYYEDEDK